MQLVLQIQGDFRAVSLGACLKTWLYKKSRFRGQKHIQSQNLCDNLTNLRSWLTFGPYFKNSEGF